MKAPFSFVGLIKFLTISLATAQYLQKLEYNYSQDFISLFGEYEPEEQNNGVCDYSLITCSKIEGIGESCSKLHEHPDKAMGYMVDIINQADTKNKPTVSNALITQLAPLMNEVDLLLLQKVAIARVTKLQELLKENLHSSMIDCYLEYYDNWILLPDGELKDAVKQNDVNKVFTICKDTEDRKFRQDFETHEKYITNRLQTTQALSNSLKNTYNNRYAQNINYLILNELEIKRSFANKRPLCLFTLVHGSLEEAKRLIAAGIEDRPIDDVWLDVLDTPPRLENLGAYDIAEFKRLNDNIDIKSYHFQITIERASLFITNPTKDLYSRLHNLNNEQSLVYLTKVAQFNKYELFQYPAFLKLIEYHKDSMIRALEIAVLFNSEKFVKESILVLGLEFTKPALAIAAADNNLDMIKMLLQFATEHSVDLNTTTTVLNQDGPRHLYEQANPLFWALFNEYEEAFLLLARHLNVHENPKESLLAMAAFNENFTSAIRLLLERGVEVNYTNRYGHTALYYALSHKHLENARILIEHGAILNDQDKEENNFADEIAKLTKTINKKPSQVKEYPYIWNNKKSFSENIPSFNITKSFISN